MLRRARTSAGAELDRLIDLLAKLPGFGPRSATRAALYLLKRRDSHMQPLSQALAEALQSVTECRICGNLSTENPCSICTDTRRDGATICVVADVADLWALERSGGFNGKYHVLGGLLSALDGVRPEDLSIGKLVERVKTTQPSEIILALPATVDGQSTALYVAEMLTETGVITTRLAQGVPTGGELEHLDVARLKTALRSRRTLD